jgi:glycosyltransferase involved in cell wall biosynthesis
MVSGNVDDEIPLNTKNNPKVSIGIPVRNGENFLEIAIVSVLNQTFLDLELIISDNNSSDSTPEICKKYAEKDKRVRFVRYDKNVGASENFNRVFKIARGKYFLWLAHDDYIHPEYIEKCVNILEQDDSIHIVYSKALAVDKKGETIKDYSSNLDLDSEIPSVRLFNSICVSHPLMEIFGLMRSSTLRDTRLFGKYSSADRVILAEMALLGKAYQIPEYLFFNRIHEKQHYMTHKTRHERVSWWNPKLKNKKVFPHWRLLWEFFKSIKYSHLKKEDKGQCYFILLLWCRKRMGYLIRNLFLLDKSWKN